MSAAMYFDFMVSPSLSELKQRQQAESGHEDGLRGRRARSHARAYTAGYERGTRSRRVAARELAMLMRVQCRCPNCQEVYELEEGAELCSCMPHGYPVEHGFATLFGHDEHDDDGSFYTTDDLRKLCLDGVEVLTLDGDRMNERLFLQ